MLKGGLIELNKREMRLAADSMPPLLEDELPGKIIDARRHFAKKRYEQEFQWTPTPEIEKAIVDAIFGQGHF